VVRSWKLWAREIVESRARLMVRRVLVMRRDTSRMPATTREVFAGGADPCRGVVDATQVADDGGSRAGDVLGGGVDLAEAGVDATHVGVDLPAGGVNAPHGGVDRRRQPAIALFRVTMRASWSESGWTLPRMAAAVSLFALS